MGYESFVGVRYLMAKRRSDVLSIITIISVAGVAIGVMAMIIVLSVMGGFEGDLKSKILGTKTHIVAIGQDDQPLPDPGQVLAALEQTEGVMGAEPFIEAEVMISSPTNLSGVILKGIDPARAGKVSDLERNLVDGDLQYLSRPGRVRAGRRGLSDPEELDRILDELEAEEGIPPDDPKAGRYVPGVEGKVYKTDDGREVVDQGASEDYRRRFLRSDPLMAPAPDAGVAEPVPPAPHDPNDAPDDKATPDAKAAPDAKDAPVGGAPVDGAVDDPYGDDAPDGFMPSLPGQAAPTVQAGQEYEDDAPDGFMPPLPGQDRPKPEPSKPAQVDEGRQIPGIIIGRELKKSLQVDIGSEVNVVSPQGDIGPSGPIPRSRPFKVVGVFYSGMYEYDTKYAYVELDSARTFLGMNGGEVTGIEVKTEDVDAVVEIRERAQAKLAHVPGGEAVRLRDWQDMNSSLFVALKMEKIAMFMVLVFIVIVASFSIASTLIMIVIAKAREVAILKSMGASNQGVMGIFLVQGSLIGALGTTVGLILGVLGCLIIEFWGIELNSDVYYISHLPVAMDLGEISLIALASMALSTGMTIFPAVQAVLLQPVEGLRYE